MKLFTIGFTKSKAAHFFGRLQSGGVRRVLDTRLNRVSQLAGFAKQDDLAYFLGAVGGIGYSVETMLAPTADMLDAWRAKQIGWPEYERRYLDLMAGRQVERHFSPEALHDGCLLCSEATPEHCHRRLAADYLARALEGIEVVHL